MSNNNSNMGALKLISLVAVAFIALVILIISIHTVPAGSRGVEKLFGDVYEEPLSEGFHLLNPLAKVVDFNVRFQSVLAKDAEGSTVDMQPVMEDLTLNYSYDPKFAPYVYNNFGDDESIEDKFIRPAMYEVFKNVTSKFTAEALVTNRSEVSQMVVSQLQQKLNKYHILVSDINVTNFHFGDAFNHAIEQKVIAAQNRLTAEQNLETKKITAQQQVVEADAQAQVTTVNATAQAKAIQAQIQALGSTQAYLQLKSIQGWNGALPQQWSGATLPFVNVNQLTAK